MLEDLDCGAQSRVVSKCATNQLAGMDYCAVITSTESRSDFAERGLGELPRQIHCDLTREGDVSRSALARHVLNADSEMVGNPALNLIDRRILMDPGGPGFRGFFWNVIAPERSNSLALLRSASVAISSRLIPVPATILARLSRDAPQF